MHPMYMGVLVCIHMTLYYNIRSSQTVLAVCYSNVCDTGDEKWKISNWYTSVVVKMATPFRFFSQSKGFVY